MWPDFHWEQDGCLCKALWNGWVASVWKEFWREVFYLTHHQRSSETNKLKYTITAEIKPKIKNWVTVKQRGFRSIYWPCVRKSGSVPTPLAPSCGKLFTRSSFKIGPPSPREALEVCRQLNYNDIHNHKCCGEITPNRQLLMLPSLQELMWI